MHNVHCTWGIIPGKSDHTNQYDFDHPNRLPERPSGFLPRSPESTMAILYINIVAFLLHTRLNSEESVSSVNSEISVNIVNSVNSVNSVNRLNCVSSLLRLASFISDGIVLMLLFILTSLVSLHNFLVISNLEKRPADLCGGSTRCWADTFLLPEQPSSSWQTSIDFQSVPLFINASE